MPRPATIRIARHQWTEVRDLFAAVKGNARVMVITEGIAAISFQWQRTYIGLYMLALGVTEVQIGLLQSVLIVTQVISTLLGGYVADRLGRKRTLVVFDIICWGVPMFLYAIARNPWYFLIGRAINGFVYVVMPSFECLFVEDVPPENRAAVFGVNQFLAATAHLLAPVAGWLVAAWGIVPAGRVIMAITMVSSVSIAISRQFVLHETEVGQARMATTTGASPVEVVRSYTKALRLMTGDRRITKFLIVRVLVAFTWVIGSTYAAIYLTDARGLGLRDATIALFPFVSAVVTMAMILLAAGRLRANAVFGTLLIGQALSILGLLSLVLAPAGTKMWAVLWAIGSAASMALYQSASKSYWADIVTDSERAMIFSASSALMALCTVPAGPLAGVLYTVAPRLPFVLAIVLQGVALLLTLTLSRHAAHDPHAS
ncbi:MAG: MFS transporter [Anaerolineae bacterium]|nr:MFS transporter [Anaerolineae bacterium]